MLKATFNAICSDIEAKLLTAPKIGANSWQSVKAPQPMPEIFNYSFTLDLIEPGAGVKEYSDAIGPNQPWADRHFIEERVSGHPKNPGQTYKIWQDGKSAADHLKAGEQFDHSYAERYWPKHAGKTEGGILPASTVSEEAHRGYRFRYGDLSDLIQVLQDDPLTRQAYLPIWFPEDLGAIVDEKARVPCTLGYHFICRGDKLHCIYPMRSCDYVRHFRDDVYLTIRLLVFILQHLKHRDQENWGHVNPGGLTMHITSLHCFESDLYGLENRARYGK